MGNASSTQAIEYADRSTVLESPTRIWGARSLLIVGAVFLAVAAILSYRVYASYTSPFQMTIWNYIDGGPVPPYAETTYVVTRSGTVAVSRTPTREEMRDEMLESLMRNKKIYGAVVLFVVGFLSLIASRGVRRGRKISSWVGVGVVASIAIFLMLVTLGLIVHGAIEFPANMERDSWWPIFQLAIAPVGIVAAVYCVRWLRFMIRLVP